MLSLVTVLLLTTLTATDRAGWLNVKDLGASGSTIETMGNVRSRAAHLERLGRAQHLIADNVFEGQQLYGGRPSGFMIRASASATQVIVRNNLFVNFNSSGVEISGAGTKEDLPGGEATITGNIIDLTCADGKPVPRTGIQISSADVTVADNQVYVRGTPADEVTATLSPVGSNVGVPPPRISTSCASPTCSTAS